MNLRIENGRIIDPSQNLDKVATLVIEAGKVVAIEKPSGKSSKQSLDATGMIIAPGFIDMHVHLRDPGYEYKEDIATGSAAAAAGGFTTLVCMANTEPVNDSPAVTRFMIDKAKQVGLVQLYPIAAITKGLHGKELTEFGALRDAGAIAFSDDGMPTSSSVMRRALEYASQFNMPVIDHSEDPLLSKDGVMHEGETSDILGLKGWPVEAETVVVYRNIQLAAKCNAHVHIAHVSAAESVRLIADAKKSGIKVTTEVTPHHLHLTDATLHSYDTVYKVNPPLRPESHVQALKAALSNDTIDALATDHAPHACFEKQGVMLGAPFGMIGLQTALPLYLQMVAQKVMTLPQMIAKLTMVPAKILNLPHGSLHVGAAADVVVFDPQAKYRFTADQILSKSINSPFIGQELTGKVKCTLRAGQFTYRS